jgi:hypothetical protein
MRGLRHALVLMPLASVASAEPAESKADPAAARAADANLETLEKRRGLTLGVMVGPSLTFGADVGTGGALTLRMGQVATPSTVVSFELNGAAVFHRVEDPADPDAPGRLVANSNSSLLAGVQYWVNPSLFLRAGAGIGNYHCNECGAPDASGMRRTDKYAGVAGGIGAGIDVVRWGSLVVALEVHSVTLFTVDGMLSNNSLGLAFSVD